jgi:hypothetical protein
MRVFRWGMCVVGRDRIWIRRTRSNYMELGYERPTLINGSAIPSITGPTYRSDAIYVSIPHACTGKRGEGVWPPPGEGATPVDPILRSSGQVDSTGIVDSVVGPSREHSPTHGFDGGSGGSHSRNVSGNSPDPLLPPGVTSSTTPPSLTLVNPSGPHTAPPTRSSTLKDVVRVGGRIAGIRRRTS